MKRWLPYLLPIVLCLLLGAIAAMLQHDALHNWYPYLRHPKLTPPAIVFPIAWGILYILIGLSAGRILTANHPLSNRAMGFWYAQLALNFMWCILFFTARNPLLGLVDIVALDVLVAYYIRYSAQVRRSAAWLVAPYMVWLLFATYLNAWIWVAN